MTIPMMITGGYSKKYTFGSLPQIGNCLCEHLSFTENKTAILI